MNLLTTKLTGLVVKSNKGNERWFRISIEIWKSWIVKRSIVTRIQILSNSNTSNTIESRKKVHGKLRFSSSQCLKNLIPDFSIWVRIDPNLIIISRRVKRSIWVLFNQIISHYELVPSQNIFVVPGKDLQPVSSILESLFLALVHLNNQQVRDLIILEEVLEGPILVDRLNQDDLAKIHRESFTEFVQGWCQSLNDWILWIKCKESGDQQTRSLLLLSVSSHSK